MTAEDISYALEIAAKALGVETVCARRLKEKSRRQKQGAGGMPIVMKQQQEEKTEKASEECSACSVHSERITMSWFSP